MLSDFIAAVVIWIIFNHINNHNGVVLFTRGLWLNAALIGAFWVTLFAFLDFYNHIYHRSRIKDVLKLITSIFVGSLILYFIILSKSQNFENFFHDFFILFFLHVVIIIFFKLILLTYIKSLVLNKKILFNTVLIGTGDSAKEIYEAVEKNRELLGFTFVGYFNISSEVKNKIQGCLPGLGNISLLKSYLESNKVEHVVIAVEQEEHEKIPDILKALNSVKVRISIIPDIYELLLGAVKVNHVFSVPLVEINQDIIPTWQKVVKRFIDVIFSLSVLVLGSPFFLIVSIITKLTSKGPVFYSQVRIGKDGKEFKIYKFRSMVTDAEKQGKPELSSPNDPRITSWGRFMRRTKIDEFPQFYNVLIGQMSLVGPRPERQYFIDQIVKIAPHYKHLQRIKPGLTSLGQVKYGYAENVDQMVKRLKYDIVYIENMSLALDFQIILYTVVIMLSGRNR